MDEGLLNWLAEVKTNPLAFVRGAFPWGEKGTTLENFTGPSTWQARLLQDLGEGIIDINKAVRIATASGHGIGKSCLVAWIILWAYTTFPDTRGVITANTEPQLKTKTWSELGRWFNLFLGKEFFQLTATALLSRDKSRERTWRIDMIPWNEKNPEAFAGLHNQGRRILIVYDEASAIPDIIWETTEGALTDRNTEIIWVVFGNPTRNTGRFKSCFDSDGMGSHWKTYQIDSRTVEITNKDYLRSLIDSYGEDSDYVRIRVLGRFPRVGEMEFISAEAVTIAMEREAISSLYDPLSLGVDVARYGSNFSVLFPRRGRDARTMERQRYQGLSTVELANRIASFHAQHSPDGIAIDGGGVGGGVVDNVRAGGIACWDVVFGGKDDVLGYATGNTGERYANKRAAMWGAMRQWINTGALPNDPELKNQLCAVHYYINVRGEIQLETKEEMSRRGIESPDDGDALALTFAYPIQPKEYIGAKAGPAIAEYEYDPFAMENW